MVNVRKYTSPMDPQYIARTPKETSIFQGQPLQNKGLNFQSKQGAPWVLGVCIYKTDEDLNPTPKV